MGWKDVIVYLFAYWRWQRYQFVIAYQDITYVRDVCPHADRRDHEAGLALLFYVHWSEIVG